jgi:hypothetical protein
MERVHARMMIMLPPKQVLLPESITQTDHACSIDDRITQGKTINTALVVQVNASRDYRLGIITILHYSSLIIMVLDEQ